MNFKPLLLLLLACGVIERGDAQDISTKKAGSSSVWHDAGEEGSDDSGSILYPQTKYPAKNWIFGTTSTKDDDAVLLHLLDATTFRDIVPPLKVHHFFVEDHYRDRQTTAVWNHAGDLVAISTGARTWADVYLFRLKDGKLTEIVTPDIFSVIKKIDPVFTETHITWISNPKWIDKQTLRLDYSGNAYVPSDYKGAEINGLADFDFTAFWKIKKDKAVFSLSHE